MCGINLIVDLKSGDDLNFTRLSKMNSLLLHRGPDNQECKKYGKVFLGHTRLSILDLSQSGNQPMESSSGRYKVIYNGEIYNFDILRNSLIQSHQVRFKSNSDTEVFLELVEIYGFRGALELIEGMFSIILYDSKKEEIFIARDRFGEKPIYYMHDDHSLLASSELSPIIKNFKNKLTLDIEQLNFFLKKSFVSPEKSIFKEIQKIKPGTYKRFLLSDENITFIEEKFYWDFKTRILDEKINCISSNKPSYLDCKHELDELLNEKISMTMCSDVPLGAFLSGGYDSSCVVAYMQKNSNNKVKTFSIGFDEADFNEAHHAKNISNFLGTDHEELYLNTQHLLDTIIKLPEVYSEPFADSSQIPTLLLSKLTKTKVTVSLSGDGGDELFGGYRRYFLGNKIKDNFKYFPAFFRNMLRKSNFIPKFGQSFSPLLSPFIKNYELKVSKLQNLLNFKDDVSLYSSLAEFTSIPLQEVLNIKYENEIWDSNLTFFEKAMIQDTIESLPGDMLTKVDIAGMHHSLETRVPLLNHKIAEFAMKLPIDYLLKNGQGKHILKDIVHDYIPKDIMERPKKGFDIPLASYLRNDIKEYSGDLLNYGKNHFSEIFDNNLIDSIWMEHQNNHSNHANLLWNLVTLFAWHNHYLR